MNKQGSVLTKEQFSGAPIERAHLHRGFTSKKTPLKWIRFFRACVLQREHANDKKKKELKKIWIGALSLIVLGFIINYFFYFPVFILIIASLGIAILFTIKINSKFRKKYTDGFDFFSDYFSAFFTLIEEDLQPQSRISLEANVKDTIQSTNLIKQEKHDANTSGFISGNNYYYEKEISKGSCFLSDGSMLSFNFTERLRNRIITKRGRVSGKQKTKQKYKSVYPFVLKMKIPKTKYILKKEVDKSNIQLAEDTSFYIVKTTRKFDIKNEHPEKYQPYSSSSIEMFSSDYFALELINLINVSYSCVTPRV
ncbi:hypothetical protein ATE84_5125 [Aquimarina sp. MAR_2010_214]|uniref:hypothetical protein n=1 Tax=Aquimarina sp. MAR_2010_214 TaxID=1250026 RepID=UPI000C70BFF3|nr:hypothetical protein [Aquimarina sp. MAR_2010_214]PKV52992.1 hypothetical protein ATE84_5125 [Aquimarina sp. MAR_2010_214]